MARPDPDLAGVQRWMQHVILHTTGDIGEALAKPGAAAIVPAGAVESVLRPSPTLAAEERLQIYRSMFPLRMQEALESDYPGLSHFLGNARFAALVRRYVAAHPSQSYTLNRLGDHFPDFVGQDREIRRQAFCGELARFELAIAQVFDAPESPVLDGEALAALGDGVADVRLQPIEAFRLGSFRYPVDAYLESVRDDAHRHPRIALKTTWVAVFRRRYSVQHLSLTREQHTLLAGLTSGATVGEAVIGTMQSSRRRLASDEFFRWFRDWVAADMFRAL